MRTKTRKLYYILAACFTLLGTLTLLNFAAAWHMEQVFLWRAAAYGLMNLLIAYGFYTQDRWILPALGLNLAANALLNLTLVAQYGTEATSSASLLSLGATAALVAFLYHTHKQLHVSPYGYYLGGAFVLLWAFTFYHAALLALQ